MSKRVLVVDDSAFMRMMLKTIITGKGYSVVGEAQDGIEAIEKYKELKPEIVTMDITMPRMDGITAIKEIMAMDPNARIIVCSAMGQKALVIEALRVGAKDFIVKPFDADRVIEAIARVSK